MSAFPTHPHTGHFRGILTPSQFFPLFHPTLFFAGEGKAMSFMRSARPAGMNLADPRKRGFQKTDSKLILKEVI